MIKRPLNNASKPAADTAAMIPAAAIITLRVEKLLPVIVEDNFTIAKKTQGSPKAIISHFTIEYLTC